MGSYIVHKRRKIRHPEPDKSAVTLRLIARMRQFARVTAAYLGISWDEIINYAALMIMSRA